MSNEKFYKAIDEIIDLVIVTKETQMEQLRASIKMAYEANAEKLDVNAIAQQIMNLPVESIPIPVKPASEFKNYKPPEERLRQAESERSYKIISEDPEIKEGDVGDLHTISFVQNANEVDYNKDFYHHCPQVQDDLVRLTHSMSKGGRKCPFCSQEFEPKQ